MEYETPASHDNVPMLEYCIYLGKYINIKPETCDDFKPKSCSGCDNYNDQYACLHVGDSDPSWYDTDGYSCWNNIDIGTATPDMTNKYLKTSDDLVVKNKNGAMKADKDKTRWDLMPWDLLEEIAEVMTRGASKYSSYNWQGLPRSRLIGAIFRHLVASIMGEELDSEWNLPHLAHAMCELLYYRWMEKNEVYNPED